MRNISCIYHQLHLNIDFLRLKCNHVCIRKKSPNDYTEELFFSLKRKLISIKKRNNLTHIKLLYRLLTYTQII